MPVYEYACTDCRKVVNVFVRSVHARKKSACPDCGGKNIHKLVSRFAFHQSMISKMEQLDPKYDRMIDSANPDLSFDNLVKKYKLDQPAPKREGGSSPNEQ